MLFVIRHNKVLDEEKWIRDNTTYFEPPKLVSEVIDLFRINGNKQIDIKIEPNKPGIKIPAIELKRNYSWILVDKTFINKVWLEFYVSADMYAAILNA